MLQQLPQLESLSRQELEQLYSVLLSTVVLLARLLGKPCPVATRADRRCDRRSEQPPIAER